MIKRFLKWLVSPCYNEPKFVNEIEVKSEDYWNGFYTGFRQAMKQQMIGAAKRTTKNTNKTTKPAQKAKN